jgi:ribonuclease G
MEDESGALALLTDFIGRPVSMQVETSYLQEQYDIVLL